MVTFHARVSLSLIFDISSVKRNGRLPISDCFQQWGTRIGCESSRLPTRQRSVWSGLNSNG